MQRLLQLHSVQHAQSNAASTKSVDHPSGIYDERRIETGIYVLQGMIYRIQKSIKACQIRTMTILVYLRIKVTDGL